MSAAAFRVDVDSFNRPPWTEDEREQLRAWMRDNGIEPDCTRAITLGEGYVIAEQDTIEFEKGKVFSFVETYPVRTLPPVWHASSLRPGCSSIPGDTP